ncbi:MAG TPA: CBS domain-containing protein [Pyrinomonadaceae bacterium]|jgi:CBS domain-containing protein
MSRYRDDRDDDFYAERTRARRAGYEDERGGYGGGDDVDRRGDFYDEYVRRRTGGHGSEGRREDYRDERERRDAYGAGRGVERRYDEDERPRRYDEDERGGRSFYEEGRDYFRERRGGDGGGGRARGTSRRGATRSHVRCRDIMTRDVTVATRDTTLEEVARLMKNEDTGVIPVVDRAETQANASSDAGGRDANASGGTNAETRRASSTIHGNGRLVGLITDRDIVVRAIAEGRDPRTTRAEEIMTEEVHTAHPNDRVIEAIRKMGDKQVRRIPIVDQDRTLRGIISMADVALETNDDRELAEALEEISSGSSFWNRIFG